MNVKTAFGILGLAALVTVGCEKTTTTGPGATTRTTTSGPTSTTRTEASQPKKLTLMAAKNHTIARGDTDKVTATINRDNFDDPVKVSFSGLPKGVTAVDTDASIASGSNSVTVTLKADATAEVG